MSWTGSEKRNLAQAGFGDDVPMRTSLWVALDRGLLTEIDKCRVINKSVECLKLQVPKVEVSLSDDIFYI